MKSRLTLPLLVALTIGGYGVGIHGSVPDVPTGQWMPGASLAQPREGAVSVALRDGRVLIIGGRTAAGPVGTVESLNSDGSLTVLHSMSLPRGGHTAVRLADDRVLVVGGTTTISSDQGTTEAATASVEIFSPGADTWTVGPALNVARTGQTMAILLDGRVLIAGGAGDQGPLDSIEVFDPDSGTFRVAGVLSTARADAAAAVAGLSQVVVAGGRNADGVLATADLIDLDSGSAAQVMLTSPRANASATALLDGLVLVAGGNDGSNDLATAEVIDPVTGASTAVGSMSQPRSGHHAALLDHNATVLVAGGTSNGAVVATTETFIPWVGQFAAANSPAQPRTNAIVASTSTEGVAVLAAGRTDNGSLPGGTELYGFATVKTDRDDYAPGTPVVITGTGWQPGEIVHLLLHEVGTGEPDVPLIATADANGAIVNDVWAPDEHDLGVRFFLTATGAASQAQATFTDNLNTATISIATLTSAGPPAVCGSAQTTFAGGDSICASVQVTFNGNAPFRVQWYAPGATVGTTAPARDIGFGSPAASPSTVTDSLTTNGTTPTGSWTVVVCDGNTAGTCTPANKVKASQTFTLNAAATSSVTFDALPIADVAPATQVLSVTIGSGSATAVTKAELPKTFSGIAVGTNVSYSYLSPVASTTAGKRYRWSSASGSGSAPGSPTQSGSFAVSANSTVTANYLAQFQLTFAQSGIGADTTGTVVTVAGNAKTAAQLPFSDFFDTGASVSYAYADPVASTVSGKRYALTTPPPSPASPLTVGAAATITGTYKVQFQFTFSQTGIGADSTGTVVTVAGAAKTAAQLPFTTDWLDSGTNLVYAYSDPVASTISGKRYALTSPAASPASPIAVSGPVTVTGTYKIQFALTFAQSGMIGDSTGTVVTVDGSPKAEALLPFTEWFDNGSLVSYSFSDPVATSVAGKRYALTTPAASPASPVSVSGAVTITGAYKTQYQLTFTQSGIGADSTGTVVTVDGSPKTAAELPFSDFFDSGASVAYTYGDPVNSSIAGKRYTLTAPAPGPANPIGVSGAATVTATYKTQYQATFAQSGIGADATGDIVTVDGNPKAYGQLPFVEWFDDGNTVNYMYADPVASAVSGKRYSLATPTPSPASPVTIAGPVTVTGTYKTQYFLTFAQSGIGNDSTGTVVTVDGSAKADAALPFSAWFDDGSLVTYAFSDPVATSVAEKRYALTTPAPSPSSPITVSGPATITGTYKIQYLISFGQVGIGADSTATVVTVNASGKLASVLPFSDWFDSGSTVSYLYSDPVATSVTGKRYALTTPAAAPTSPIAVAGPLSIVGTYKTQFLVTFAQSGIGSPDIGSNPVVKVAGADKTKAVLPFSSWYDQNATVDYSFYTPISTAPVSDKQYELTNSASLPSTPHTVTGAITITGQYAIATYSILYHQPIDQSAGGGLVVNTGKNGRVIPVKIEFFKNGASVQSGTVLMKVNGSPCSGGTATDLVTEYADAGNSNGNTNLFRWNVGTPGFWIYNLDTGALGLQTNACYRLDVYLNATTGSNAVLLSSSTFALFKPVK